MKILVACEESQAVTIELRKRGHEAYSCDIEECSGGRPDWHIRQDILPLLDGSCSFRTADGVGHNVTGAWDMIIAFPPCTHLTRAGADKWAEKRADGRQQAAIKFVQTIYAARCRKIAIENPIGILSTVWRKPDQIIQPYWFGHTASKPTCLWLKGLPRLRATEIVEPEWHYYFETYTQKEKRISKWFYDLNTKSNRAKLRSKTFPGIAAAMADQWTQPFTVYEQLDIWGNYNLIKSITPPKKRQRGTTKRGDKTVIFPGQVSVFDLKF